MNDFPILFNMYYSTGSLVLTLFHLLGAIAIFKFSRANSSAKILGSVFILFALKFSMVFLCYLIYRKWSLVTVPIMLFFLVASAILLVQFSIFYSNENNSKKQKLLLIIPSGILVFAVLYYSYTLLPQKIVYNYLTHTYKFYTPVPDFNITNPFLAFIIGFVGLYIAFFAAPDIGLFLINFSGWLYILFLVYSFRKTREMGNEIKKPIRISAIALFLSHSIAGALNFLSTISLFNRDLYEITFVFLHLTAAVLVIHSLKNFLKLSRNSLKIIYITVVIFMGFHLFNNFYQQHLDKKFDKKQIALCKTIIKKDFNNFEENKIEYVLKYTNSEDSSKHNFVYNKNNIKFIKSTAGDEKKRIYRSSENANYIAYKVSLNDKDFFEVAFPYSEYRTFLDEKFKIITYILMMLTIISIFGFILVPRIF